MIRAVVRPEKAEILTSSLAKASFPALTRWDVFGRGKQKGIRVGSQLYSELPKTLFLIVVNDEQADAVVRIIMDIAFTGYPGDGKIFVTPVESVYTIRTGKAEL